MSTELKKAAYYPLLWSTSAILLLFFAGWWSDLGINMDLAQSIGGIKVIIPAVIIIDNLLGHWKPFFLNTPPETEAK